MKKAWIQRAAGISLVAVAVGAIPFLNEKGTLERPVTVTIPFERGVSIDDDAKALVALAFKESAARPDASVVVSGHTGSRGDAQANMALSERRAETIAGLLSDQGLDPDRMETAGLGGAQLLPQQEGESDRAYQRRLSRVDVLITP